MRKNFGAKAFSYPQPVFIIATYNDDGSADAMNAAWGGISDRHGRASLEAPAWRGPHSRNMGMKAGAA